MNEIKDQFFTLDHEWRFTFVNEQMEEVIGHPRASLLGKSIWELFPELVESDFYHNLIRAAARGVPAHFEFHIPAWNRWFENHVYPVGNKVTVLVTEITDRKRAEERLRAVLTSINDHLASYDWQWRFTYLNDNAARMLGKPKNELLGQCIWKVFPEAVGNQYYKEVHQALEEQRVIRSEHYYASYNRWYENHIYPSADGVTVFSADITWRKRSEQHQALLAELGGHIRPDCSADDNLLSVATLVGTWLGVARAVFCDVDPHCDFMMIRRHYTHTVPEIAGPYRLSEFGLVVEELRKGQTVVCEDVLTDPRTQDFQTIYEEMNIRAFLRIPLVREGHWVAEFSLHNSTPRRWLAEEIELVRTVAERTWLAVENLRLAEQTRDSECLLQEALTQLRLAMHVAQLGTWEFDPRTLHVLASESTDVLFGLPSTGEPRPIDDYLKSVHPADRNRVRQEMIEAAQNESEISIEYRLLQPDGSVRWMASRGDILYDRSGKGVRMIGALFDITDRKSAEEALREADRRKDEFLATLAHELRNPLAPIRNALHIMQRADGDLDKIDQARQTMERQVQQLTRLVDDLLDVSRITRGKIELRKERVMLVQVLERAIETSLPVIEASGHQLSASLPKEFLWIEADVTRLAQVISNLLNNAAKYTREEGRISLVASLENDQAAVRVRDNGIGIPKEMLSNIFEVFTQVDTSLERAQGGLGIGLTIVKQLVEMHGGTIEAHSEGPGRGSEFVVRLPVVKPPKGVKAPVAGHFSYPPPVKVGKKGNKSPGPLRILVVDDNKDAAGSLAELLHISGHEVRVSHDGPQALQEAQKFLPQVLLLDIGLPGMNGYEVARKMRELPLLQNALLIAQTGWGQEEDRRRSKEAGFKYHLVKPVDPDVLLDILDKGCKSCLSPQMEGLTES